MVSPDSGLTVLRSGPVPDEVEVRHLDGLRADPRRGSAAPARRDAIRTGVPSARSGRLSSRSSRPRPFHRALAAGGDLRRPPQPRSAPRARPALAPKTLRVEADAEGSGSRWTCPRPSAPWWSPSPAAICPARQLRLLRRRRYWDPHRPRPPARSASMTAPGDLRPAWSGRPIRKPRQRPALPRGRPTPKEPPMPEPVIARRRPSPDPVPPVPPVITDAQRARGPRDARAGHGRLVPVWVEERTHSTRRSTAPCAWAMCSRAMITRAAERSGAARAGGRHGRRGRIHRSRYPPGAVDRPPPERADRRPGRRRDRAAHHRRHEDRPAATDPTAAWRSENAAVAESDPAFEAVTFAPKQSRRVLQDLARAARGQHQHRRDAGGDAGALLRRGGGPRVPGRHGHPAATAGTAHHHQRQRGQPGRRRRRAGRVTIRSSICSRCCGPRTSRTSTRRSWRRARWPRSRSSRKRRRMRRWRARPCSPDWNFLMTANVRDHRDAGRGLHRLARSTWATGRR